jgi:hypothetical protein
MGVKRFSGAFAHVLAECLPKGVSAVDPDDRNA